MMQNILKDEQLDEIILVVGLSRGGTNIVWNIIQSHQKALGTAFEVNEIFGKSSGISLWEKGIVEFSALTGIISNSARNILRNRLILSMLNSVINFEDDQFKSPREKYTVEELSELVLTTKLVSAWEINPFRQLLKRNDALKYLPVLDKISKKLKIVIVQRNMFSQVEGWMRRGASIKNAVKWYNYYLKVHNQLAEKYENVMFVDFDEVLQDPFEQAIAIYRFLELPDPDNIQHLRFAPKPTVSSENSLRKDTYRPKYWANRVNFGDVLSVNVSKKQKENLNQKQINYIKKHALE